MYSIWFSGLSSEDQEILERAFKSSGMHVVNRLVEMIDKELEIIANMEISEDQFKNHSWPYLQAFNNGKKTQLMRIRKWLTTELPNKTNS